MQETAERVGIRLVSCLGQVDRKAVLVCKEKKSVCISRALLFSKRLLDSFLSFLFGLGSFGYLCILMIHVQRRMLRSECYTCGGFETGSVSAMKPCNFHRCNRSRSLKGTQS